MYKELTHGVFMYCTNCGSILNQEGKCSNCGMSTAYIPNDAVWGEPPVVSAIKEMLSSRTFFILCIVQSICVFTGMVNGFIVSEATINFSVGFIPMIIIGIGFWKLYFQNKKGQAGERIPTMGITIVKVGTYIGTITSAVWFFLIGILCFILPNLIIQITEGPLAELYVMPEEILLNVNTPMFSTYCIIAGFFCLVTSAIFIVLTILFSKTFKIISLICIVGTAAKAIPMAVIVIIYIVSGINFILTPFSGVGFMNCLAIGVYGFLLAYLLHKLRKRLAINCGY